MQDGQAQRKALSSAEQALQALQAGAADRARQAAARAAELDQIGVYGGFVEAVGAAANEIDATGSISREAWRALSAVLPQGPLQAIADEAAAGTQEGAGSEG